MARLASADHLHDPVLDHMRKEFVRILVTDTVSEALGRVQQNRVAGRIVYFYVVDEHERLQGVVSTRRLLLSAPQTPVAEIMDKKVITLPATATLLEACEFFIMHRLLAFPVVDADRRMLGVVDVELYTDEIADLTARQESEAVFQLIGVRLAQVRQASVLAAYRARFPWLLCNLGGGAACAVLAAQYEHLLARFVVLAAFIPIVLALAESVSIQSLTLTLQGYPTRRLRRPEVLRAVYRESGIGLLLGLSCGCLVGLAAWLWLRSSLMAWCITTSIALAVATGALFGRMVPCALRAIERDPKAASGPIVLAMTDVATLFYYLGLAAWMLVE